MQIIPRKSIFHVFFMKFVFWEELFVIYSLSFLFCIILIDFLYYLSYIIHKYLIWVIFLLNSSYNVVQKLSKVIQKLSIFKKSVPKNLEKFRKIRKKSDFFTFFLMVSAAFLSKVDWSFNVRKIRKNVTKKSWKKNDFHFCKLFF